MNIVDSPPTITTIIAVFNGGEFVAEAISSALAQSYPQQEVIVVDDGSTDDTPRIVQSFSKVRYIRQINLGQPAARNNGIRHATGTHIAFLDADDLWAPSKLADQVESLRQRPGCSWSYCGANIMVMRSGRTPHLRPLPLSLPEGDILTRLFLNNFIPSPTPLVRRDALLAVGLFDESPNAHIGEDWDMWLRLAAQYQATFVPKALATVRRHGHNMTARMDVMRAFQSECSIAQRASSRNPELLSPLLSNVIERSRVKAIRRFLARGDGHSARTLLRSSALFQTRPGAWLGVSALCCLPPVLLRTMALCRDVALRSSFGVSSLSPENQEAQAVAEGLHD